MAVWVGTVYRVLSYENGCVRNCCVWHLVTLGTTVLDVAVGHVPEV